MPLRQDCQLHNEQHVSAPSYAPHGAIVFPIPFNPLPEAVDNPSALLAEEVTLSPKCVRRRGARCLFRWARTSILLDKMRIAWQDIFILEWFYRGRN